MRFSSIGGASGWEWVCARLLWLSVLLWRPASLFFLFSILFYSISFNCKWVLKFIELNLRSHMCTFRLLNVPFGCEREIGIQIELNFLVSISPNSFFCACLWARVNECARVLSLRFNISNISHQSGCAFFFRSSILAISRRFVSAFFIGVVATLRKGKRCMWCTHYLRTFAFPIDMQCVVCVEPANCMIECFHCCSHPYLSFTK